MAHDEAWQLRGKIYDHFATNGSAPGRHQLAEWCGEDDRVETLLAVLHDRHAVVLDLSGEIRMALPFSAIPTDTGWSPKADRGGRTVRGTRSPSRPRSVSTP